MSCPKQRLYCNYDKEVRQFRFNMLKQTTATFAGKTRLSMKTFGRTSMASRINFYSQLVISLFQINDITNCE